MPIVSWLRRASAVPPATVQVRVLFLAALFAGCRASKHPDSAGDGAPEQEPQPVCAVDEAREFFCEELLPLRSTAPAEPPYQDCPGLVDSHSGNLPGRPGVARFDPDYTRHIRLRQPPGNSCCYSWCARPILADPTRIDPRARCDQHQAQRETYCMAEPEAGTTQPARGGHDRCPSAIVPPELAAFAAPREGALFDPVFSGQRRQLGFRECCYAWCSVVPGVGEPVRRGY